MKIIKYLCFSYYFLYAKNFEVKPFLGLEDDRYKISEELTKIIKNVFFKVLTEENNIMIESYNESYKEDSKEIFFKFIIEFLKDDKLYKKSVVGIYIKKENLEKDQIRNKLLFKLNKEIKNKIPILKNIIDKNIILIKNKNSIIAQKINEKVSIADEFDINDKIPAIVSDIDSNFINLRVEKDISKVSLGDTLIKKNKIGLNLDLIQNISFVVYGYDKELSYPILFNSKFRLELRKYFFSLNPFVSFGLYYFYNPASLSFRDFLYTVDIGFNYDIFLNKGFRLQLVLVSALTIPTIKTNNLYLSHINIEGDIGFLYLIKHYLAFSFNIGYLHFFPIIKGYRDFGSISLNINFSLRI